MANRYKHLLFDFDRTFWDVDANQRDALSELYDDFDMGRFFSSREAFAAEFRRINEDLWTKYRDGEIDKIRLRTGRFLDLCAAGGCDDEELGRKLDEAYVRNVPFHNKLLPYSVEILQYLNAKGYTMSLVTNGLNEVQFNKVERCGLAPFFRNITTSDMAGVNKPDPRIFETALEEVGIDKKDAVMIGDDPYSDIFGATRAGLDTIFFNLTGQEHDQNPTYEIRSLKELEQIL